MGWEEATDLDALDGEALLGRIQESGMVGLGGACVPTHVKLGVPPGNPVDTLVVNGCECEPFLTTDHRVMVEQPAELLAGIRIAMRACGAPRAVIGIEDNKPDAFAAITARLPADGTVTAQLVPAKYPQGSEKMLIKALPGREVPSGGFPFQVGVVVQNVATLAQVGELLPRRQGLIERVVTVTGPGVARPGNYRIPLGTPLAFVLFSGGLANRAFFSIPPPRRPAAAPPHREGVATAHPFPGPHGKGEPCGSVGRAPE